MKVFSRIDCRFGNPVLAGMFHVVVPAGPHGYAWVTTEEFRETIASAKQMGARFLTAAEVAARVRGTSTVNPWPAVALLFDDGHNEQHDNGTPILRALGGHAIVTPECNPTKLGVQLTTARLRAMVDSGRWSLGTHGYVGHGDGVTRYKADGVTTNYFYNDRLYLPGAGRMENDTELRARLHDDIEQALTVLAPYGTCSLVTWPWGLYGQSGNAQDTIPDMLAEILEDFGLVGFGITERVDAYPVIDTTSRFRLSRYDFHHGLRHSFATLLGPRTIAPIPLHTNGVASLYYTGTRVPGVGWVVGRWGGGCYGIYNEDTWEYISAGITVKPEGSSALNGSIFIARSGDQVFAAQWDLPRITRITDLATGAATATSTPVNHPYGLCGDDSGLYMVCQWGGLWSISKTTLEATLLGNLPNSDLKRYVHGAVKDGHLYSHFTPNRSIRKIRISDRVLIDEWAAPEALGFYPLEVTDEYIMGTQESSGRVLKAVF